MDLVSDKILVVVRLVWPVRSDTAHPIFGVMFFLQIQIKKYITMKLDHISINSN
jgi:hypothetical protein